MRQFRHLTFNDRLIIESMINQGKSASQIALRLGVHRATIHRELKRGRYQYRTYQYEFEDRYSPDIAHEKYKEQLKKKGPT